MLRRSWVTFAVPLVLLLGVALIPYIWILLASFKQRIDLITPEPKWVFEPTAINYIEIFGKGFDKFLLKLNNNWIFEHRTHGNCRHACGLRFLPVQDTGGESPLLLDTCHPAWTAGRLCLADVFDL